jgi:hypothetical protein
VVERGELGSVGMGVGKGVWCGVVWCGERLERGGSVIEVCG